MSRRSLATDPTPSPDRIGRWLFLRLLGCVFLIAFVSLWVQVDGLIGSEGILPVADHLDWVRQNTGVDRYWRAPTLLWLSQSDLMLDVLCGTGVLLSLLLIVGVATIPVLFLLWVAYLSMVIGGQTFLSFQWDTLLLEVGFSALFVAPATLRPRWPGREPAPAPAGMWLLRLLLFKLMVLSGAVKLICMDRTWWALTALDYHYFTQPLPTWTSWYAHHLPAWFQKTSVLIMFAIEIGVPFLIFFRGLGRRVAFTALVLLQILIAATGNYGFFNLLTVVLCVPLLDDKLLRRIVPSCLRPTAGRLPASSWKAGRVPAVLLVVILSGVSCLTMVREVVRTAPADGIGEWVDKSFERADRLWLSWSRPTVLRWIAPFRTINGYGLFRGMTTARPELVIEGSDDGRTWQAYEFRWKAGRLSRRPRFVAPHQPRLDWQMWFAALNPRRAAPWLQGLTLRLLEGSPVVLELFDEDPFEGRAPRFIRWVGYRYEFTTPEQRSSDGHWWRREPAGLIMRPVSLESFGQRN